MEDAKTLIWLGKPRASATAQASDTLSKAADGAEPTLPATAEGFELELSEKSATGYKGVHTVATQALKKPYTVTYAGKHIGYYASAVEAAVAYAKHKATLTMEFDDDATTGRSSGFPPPNVGGGSSAREVRGGKRPRSEAQSGGVLMAPPMTQPLELAPKRYGAEVNGLRVEVQWDGDVWFSGVIREFSAIDDKHLVRYDDGDQQWHNLSEDEASGDLRWTASQGETGAGSGK